MSPRHTPLFACAHVPDFFVQAAFRHYRGLAKERPAAVLDGPDSLMKVLACNGHARKAGVRTGMTKIQAEACLGITLRKRSAEDEDLVQQALIDCGFKFAFRVESTCPGTIIMDLSGTQRLLGQPQEIANNIVDECGSSFDVAIGMAANPDTAFYAACGFAGVTVISPGEEASRLGPLPVSVLQADSEILETLESWGVRHFKALASLPPIPLSARLGQLGLHLQQLALGKVKRELVPAEPLPVFREGIELEEAVELLEPLGFVLNRLLEQLCQRLIARSLATDQLLVDLALEDHDQQLHLDSSPPSRSALHQTRLKLPVPTQDAKILLKLLQLDLAAHPPQAAVKEVTIEACPARVRTTQTGLFQPLAPEPTNLEITLARLRAVVGERDQQGCERVGFPVVTDTHRPDTFQVMQSFSPARERGYKMRGERVANTLTLRVFRPPLPAKVKLRDAAPSTISFLGTRAQVKDASGPWRGRGEWWSRVGEWNREEWDIGLMSDGHPAIYRIFQDCGSGQWFVEGLYD
ncbi:MAG: Y-family DNA polymerase [Candidatus Angelobacter sp.]